MHRSAPRPVRPTSIVLRALVAIVLAFLGLVAVIYFKQHSMIYHPRPYDASYAQALPANGQEISYTLPFGQQLAFYVPARNNERLPRRLWIAFCGNGSLALDWTTVLAGYPNGDDAFLLVDYPGYGKCQGYASIASMRASSDAAVNTLAIRLGFSAEELEPRLCAIGHSMGSAVRLILQRVIESSEWSRSRLSRLYAKKRRVLSADRCHIY